MHDTCCAAIRANRSLTSCLAGCDRVNRADGREMSKSAKRPPRRKKAKTSRSRPGAKAAAISASKAEPARAQPEIALREMDGPQFASWLLTGTELWDAPTGDRKPFAPAIAAGQISLIAHLKKIYFDLDGL